jgi:hypothetical protein
MFGTHQVNFEPGIAGRKSAMGRLGCSRVIATEYVSSSSSSPPATSVAWMFSSARIGSRRCCRTVEQTTVSTGPPTQSGVRS